MGFGRKASLVLAGQAVGAGMGYLIILLVGRYIEPAAYGAFAFALAIFGFLSIVTSLGFGEAHVHFIARGVDPLRALAVYTRVRLALVTTAVAIAAVVLLFLSGTTLLTDTTVPILAAALAIQTIGNLRQVAFDHWMGQERVNRVELARTFDTSLALIGVAVLGLALAGSRGRWTPVGPVAPWLADVFGIPPGGMPAFEVGFAFALAYLVAKAISLLPVAWWWGRDRLRIASWDPALARQYVSYALPLALAAAPAVVLTYTDTVMVGFFRSDAEVGHYGVAQRLTQVAVLASLAVATPLLPRFSALLQSGDKAEARRILHMSERYLLLLAMPVAAVLATLPGPALHILVGDQYLGAAGPLRFLAVWAVVFAATTPARAKVLGSGQASANLIAGLLAVGLNVPLNLLLIPRFGFDLGGTGAAIGTVVATIASGAYLRHRMQRDLGVPAWDGVLFRLTIAAAGASLFWWVSWTYLPETFGRFWQFAAWSLAGALVFAGLAALMGMLGREDLRILTRLASPASLLRELGGRK